MLSVEARIERSCLLEEMDVENRTRELGLKRQQIEMTRGRTVKGWWRDVAVMVDANGE